MDLHIVVFQSFRPQTHAKNKVTRNCNLQNLETVNVRSIRDTSDFITSNIIDLLDITETWLTTRETSADLIEIILRVSLSSRNPKYRGEGEEWVCSFHLPTILPRSVCLPKQVLSVYLGKLSVVSLASIFLTNIARLVLLLLFQ